jgi:glutamate--cysteine ligase
VAHTGDIDPRVFDAISADPTVLARTRRGIEKESLRVGPDGKLSPRPHPEALGSALTHPQITTDFSEAQLELITDVHDSARAAIDQLTDVHRFVYQHMFDDELLWTASMPCLVGEDEIPVGRYGTSNIGRIKSVYRMGLGNRYGRSMQTISGIHYNFSAPESFWPFLAKMRNARADQAFRTAAYFGLIRNFRRYSWLLIYLFGASPAICKSFMKGRDHELEGLDEGTLHLPYGTSLRMGRIGYQSDAQASLHISYNTLDEYAQTMHQALTQPYPPYETIGVRSNGEYQQLNTALLQIENEFYGTIRPKPLIQSGERPLMALRKRGVEYVEVRCLDLNPFLPVGIDEHQIRFLDTFLLGCLLADSPPDDEDQSHALQRNQLAIVERGRTPDLLLERDGQSLPRDEWANAILDRCARIAAVLDAERGNDEHSYAVELQRNKVTNPDLTPSARVLGVMREQRVPFFRFAMNQSNAHKGYFHEHPLRARRLADYRATAVESLERQKQIEASDETSFETFLEQYLQLP